MAQLSQGAFDALQSFKFSNATHLNGFFIGHTGKDFIDWFNANLAGKDAFVDRRITPDPGEKMTAVKKEFVEFWDAIPFIFNKKEISIFEFSALACIVINEVGGRFRSITEKCRQGRLDENGVLHAGLPYAFDAFKFKGKNAGRKRSYNTLNSDSPSRRNLTAFECFASKIFCEAHKDMPMAELLSGADDPSKIDPAWKGELYPADKFPTINETAITGFIIQADFYKFRGRGPIQITGRLPYRELVKFIQQYKGANPVLKKYKAQWKSLSPDDACTVSRNADWEEIFQEKIMVGMSVRVFAEMAMPGGNILHIENDLSRLNADTIRPGSVYCMGRIISGGDGYAKNKFKPRVVEMLEKMASHLPQGGRIA